MMSIQNHIDATWNKLKDFQKATVNYTMEQFFNQSRDKMLIADEVGLGKTIVSRGIISKMYEKHHAKFSEEPFNVIYICSNQAIAKQNIEKRSNMNASPMFFFDEKNAKKKEKGRVVSS